MFMSPEDLDKIVEEGDADGTEGERTAASKAEAQRRQRRRLLSEGSDGSSANDTEPDTATGELHPVGTQ